VGVGRLRWFEVVCVDVCGGGAGGGCGCVCLDEGWPEYDAAL